MFNKFNERNWRVMDALAAASAELGKPPAQVALNWVATQPGITSTILGATKLAQLDDNLASLDFTIPPEVRARLDQATAIEEVHPYVFFQSVVQDMITGGVKIEAWAASRG